MAQFRIVYGYHKSLLGLVVILVILLLAIWGGHVFGGRNFVYFTWDNISTKALAKSTSGESEVFPANLVNFWILFVAK